MTAMILARAPGSTTGLRPVDPKRDMSSLAELIEIAFSNNLETGSKRMLRWMKFIGRLGWPGWLLSYYSLPPAARPQGFVWEVEGRLVGNASVLPVGGYPQRWILVNVAVHPDFQRQGIARQLVAACVAYVRECKGSTLLLQTESGKLGLQGLYATLGFKKIATRTTWVGRFERREFQSMSLGRAMARSRQDWREQAMLSRRVHPEGLIWPFPPEASIYRSVGWMDLIAFGEDKHWVVWEDEELVASMSFRWSHEINAWRMLLVVDPKVHEQVERDLVVCGLANLPARKARIELEYPSGIAADQLRDLGFIQKRHLTWMKRNLQD